MVLPIRHSLQGHPGSGNMYMQMINKVLLEKLEFKSTTHDRCIYKKHIDGKLVFILRQVDDILIACDNEDLAKDITNKIGRLISFKEELDEKEHLAPGVRRVWEGKGRERDQKDTSRRKMRKAVCRELPEETHGK